jgi:small-conductance mechanosensitive channel
MKNFFQYLEGSLSIVVQVLLATAFCALVVILVHWFLVARRKDVDPGKNVRQQLVRLLVTFIVLASAVLALSFIEKSSATVLAGLLGVAISAAITISSATFISNAMAGLMLRAVKNFRLGDYIRVGDRFGRVSERGLFHVEIQTEDRDLATLPNLYLVSQPVTVVRASGTIVSTTVSLGYDVPHTKVEAALENAARAAKLDEPFVYVLELGDFSITYRIAAFLTEIKHLLSARSRLRACVLDALHAEGIEIVSPIFMNQRQLSEKAVMSRPQRPPTADPAREEPAPEDIMFDKAERAEQRQMLDKLNQQSSDLEGQLEAGDDEHRKEVEIKLRQLREQRERLEQSLTESTEESDD